MERHNDAWRESWRKIAPHLPTRGLEALRDELEAGGPGLVRRTTAVMDSRDTTRIAACCPVAYCGWRGEGLGDLLAIEGFFGRACRASHGSYSIPFVAWWDSTPDAAARPLLLAEVRRELERRAGGAAPKVNGEPLLAAT